MLEIKNIYKTFNKGTVNEKKALNGVSFTLNDGDFVTVIGGNGAGKSTTLNAVAGVWPVDSGSIIIDGINVTGLPAGLSGSDDGNRRHYGDTGKSGSCRKARKAQRAPLGNYKKRAGTV
mgnify:CR=1 FL=1